MSLNDLLVKVNYNLFSQCFWETKKNIYNNVDEIHKYNIEQNGLTLPGQNISICHFKGAKEGDERGQGERSTRLVTWEVGIVL